MALQSSAAAEPLSAGECRKLYSHQLSVYSTDGILAGPIAEEKSSLSKHASAAENLCRKKTTRKSYECQMKASTLIGLHECRSVFEASESEGAKSEGKTSRKETAGTNKGNNNSSAGSAAQTDDEPGKVSAGQCRKAYERLLLTYRESPYLDEKEKNRLVNYWISPQARGAFETKCMKLYRPSDIICILKSSDRSMMQACMLKIPDF